MAEYIAAHTTHEDITIRAVRLIADTVDEAQRLADTFFHERHKLPDGNIAVFQLDELPGYLRELELESAAKRNDEGLTWEEWRDAAGGRTNAAQRRAWREGEDPTEWKNKR